MPLLAIIFVLTLFSCTQTQTQTENKNSGVEVYERIIKTGVVRASYLSYPPACMKDTKTGEMSGIFVEVLQKACDNLGLELEWTEEVGWAY